MKIPLVRPSPPQLSRAVMELQSLEQSGIFSNFEPSIPALNRRNARALFSAVKALARPFAMPRSALCWRIKKCRRGCGRGAACWTVCPSAQASPSQLRHTRRFGVA